MVLPRSEISYQLLLFECFPDYRRAELRTAIAHRDQANSPLIFSMNPKMKSEFRKHPPKIDRFEKLCSLEVQFRDLLAYSIESESHLFAVESLTQPYPEALHLHEISIGQYPELPYFRQPASPMGYLNRHRAIAEHGNYPCPQCSSRNSHL